MDSATTQVEKPGSSRLRNGLARFKSILFPARYDVVVISAGGVGTTMLTRFLQTRCRVNSDISTADGIKHANSPNHPIFRAIKVSRAVYLFGDPRLAAFSIFRRSYQCHMIPKLSSSAHANASEYRKYVRANRVDISLPAMLQAGKDCFGFERHWDNWIERSCRFPTLFVRFSDLHKNLPELFDFIGLPEPDMARFPKLNARKSSLGHMSESELAGLTRIYSRLIEKQDNFPSLSIKAPGPSDPRQPPRYRQPITPPR